MANFAFCVCLCLAFSASAIAANIPLAPGSPVEAVLTFDANSFTTDVALFNGAGRGRRMLETQAISSVASRTEGCVDPTNIPGLCAMAHSAGTNISTSMTGGNRRHLLAPGGLFDIKLAAKKSATSNFALLDFDFSGKDATAFLKGAEGSTFAIGGFRAVVTSAFLFIDADPDVYADFSPTFFLDATNVGRSVKIGIETAGKDLSPDSVVLAISYNVFVNGVFALEIFNAYEATQVSVSKEGLPTVDSILNTLT